jgi:hypothetical protein
VAGVCARISRNRAAARLMHDFCGCTCVSNVLSNLSTGADSSTRNLLHVPRVGGTDLALHEAARIPMCCKRRVRNAAHLGWKNRSGRWHAGGLEGKLSEKVSVTGYMPTHQYVRRVSSSMDMTAASTVRQRDGAR